MNKISLKIKILCFILGFKIVIDKSMNATAQWRFGKIIYVKSINNITDMTILHEIGHYYNGYDCCRFHDEWRAHGFAVGIAKMLRIKKELIEDMNEKMNVYADIYKYYVCPRLNNNMGIKNMRNFSINNLGVDLL
jgi:hypothetical protein